MSGNKQVSHPRHQRPTISDAGRGREKGVNPKTDRGWGGAGAVGWGVLGAFGSIDKDTGAQVVRKTADSNVKMVKNDKGLWVKVRVDEPPASSGRGRGRGIPALGGGDPVIGGLQDDEAYGDVSGDERGEREDSPPPRSSRDGKRGSPSRSRSRSRERREKRRRSRSGSRSRGHRSRHSRSRSKSRDRRPKSSHRSRSRSKGRRERRSRSGERRERRRERRSRSHSRSPRGKPRDDRQRRDDRKLSAERDRPAEREKERERERKRSTDRERNYKRSAERERKRSVERERKPSPAKARREVEEEEGPPPVMSFTAAQLADRLVEVYNLASSQRLAQIMSCFAPSVVLSNLKTRADVLKGAEALRDSMPSDFAKWDAECTRRLYMEPSSSGGGENQGPTFCLDFYPAGHAPGVNAMGKGGVRLPTVLLYRVVGNVIDQVWIAPDKEGLAEGEKVGEGKVRGSKIYASVAEVLKAQYGEGVDITHVFNDYKDIEVWG